MKTELARVLDAGSTVEALVMAPVAEVATGDDQFVSHIFNPRHAAGLTIRHGEVTMGKGDSPRDAQSKKP